MQWEIPRYPGSYNLEGSLSPAALAEAECHAEALVKAEGLTHDGLDLELYALQCSWPLRSEPKQLQPNEVHVWSLLLDSLDPSGFELMQRIPQLLSEDELSRARRLRFERDRTRFTVCRGALRILLGQYLHKDPKALRFHYTRSGKPHLVTFRHEPSLRFNVSHSEGLALIAVALADEVGVDVERLRPIADRDLVAKSFFAPEEIRELHSLHPQRRDEGFFNGWTRKEAFLKARGLGVTAPLQDFAVSLTPGEPPAIHVLGRGENPEGWKLFDLVPAAGYKGALAIHNSHALLNCWHWQPSQGILN